MRSSDNETPFLLATCGSLIDLIMLDKQHSRLYEDVLPCPTPHNDTNVTHDALCASGGEKERKKYESQGRIFKEEERERRKK